MTSANLKISVLSKNNFGPYGEVIELKDAEKLIINQGTTTRFNALSTVDVVTENGEPILSIFEAQRRPEPIKLEVMERHPLGSQAFFPLSRDGWLVVVCKSNSSGDEPDLSTVECFFAEGDQGVNYFKGTWHHPLIVLEESQKFLVVDRQGDGCNLNEFFIDNIDIKIDFDRFRNSVLEIN
jgi:ureidoglycolate lyase